LACRQILTIKTNTMKPVFKKINKTKGGKLIAYDVNRNIYILDANNQWIELSNNKIYEILLKSKINLHNI